jgi:MFS family permease
MLLLTGIALSLIQINALPMVADSAPAGQLGSFISMYYLASQSSAVVGPIVVGKLITTFGDDYRMIFSYSAAMMFLAFVFFSSSQTPNAWSTLRMKF